MEWVNYHHLLYFWTVAKEGGITAAAEALHLSQPTLSTQIAKLEKSMGVKLFDRRGRGLVLTDTGQLVYRYADEIFGLGRELIDAVKGGGSPHLYLPGSPLPIACMASPGSESHRVVNRQEDPRQRGSAGHGPVTWVPWNGRAASARYAA